MFGKLIFLAFNRAFNCLFSDRQRVPRVQTKSKPSSEVETLNYLYSLHCVMFFLLAISASSRLGNLFVLCVLIFCLLISLIALPVWAFLFARLPFSLSPACLPMRYLLFTHKDKGHGSRFSVPGALENCLKYLYTEQASLGYLWLFGESPILDLGAIMKYS